MPPRVTPVGPNQPFAHRHAEMMEDTSHGGSSATVDTKYENANGLHTTYLSKKTAFFSGVSLTRAVPFAHAQLTNTFLCPEVIFSATCK